ncbi:unnamed protein product [Rhodiola kirilowii]
MSNYQLRSRSGRAYNPYMQPDIMFKIFMKLPIEAVVTCKCVCKTWRGLVEDPYFIEQHRRFSLCRAPRALVQPINEFKPSPQDGNIYLADCEAHKARALPVPPALDILGKDLEVTSTCDGLLCMASVQRQAPVYVYNPMLDRLVKLPSNGIKRMLTSHVIGIIFHESSGSYKVVRGYRFKKEGQEQHRFEMITLGEAAWKELTPPSHIKYLDFGRPFEWRGAIHWRIHSVHDSTECIMSFDIDKEAFQIVSLQVNPIERNRLVMLVLDDDLVLVDRYNSYLKIWKVEGDVINGFSINQYTLMQTYMQWNNCFYCQWMAETGRDGTYMLQTTYCTNDYDLKFNLVNFEPETGSYTQLNLSGMPEQYSTFAFRPTLVCPLRARVTV